MRFRRTKTREIFKDEPYWQKGYEFEGVEIPDYGVKEKVKPGNLPRVHASEHVEKIDE